MRIVTVVVMVLLFATVNGQKNDFIYLYSGQKIDARQVVFKKPFFGKDVFLVDSVKYDPQEVKFYQNGEGFFGNTSDAFERASFAERVAQGRINIFEGRKMSYSAPMYSGGAGGGVMMGGGVSSSIVTYYNRGWDDLKEATYKNLCEDLKDNATCMGYMEQYRSLRNTQIGLGILGSALMVGGLVALVAKTSDYKDDGKDSKPNDSFEIGVMVTGAVCWGVVWILDFSKTDKIDKAIEEYNR